MRLRRDSRNPRLDAQLPLLVTSASVGIAAIAASWIGTHLFTGDSALYEGSIVLLFGASAFLCAGGVLRFVGRQPPFVFRSAVLGYLGVCAPVLMFIWYGGSISALERLLNITIGIVPVVASTAAGLIVGDVLARSRSAG